MSEDYDAFNDNRESERNNYEVGVLVDTPENIKKEVKVRITVCDFRVNKEDEESQIPTYIYCTGFGLNDEEVGEGLDAAQLEEAKNNNARYIKVSIMDIPPLRDKKSDTSKPPTFDVDGRVAIKAIHKATQEGFMDQPVVVSGYSEGAGVAISLANEIDKRQSQMPQKPKNVLRLWSMTGVVDLKPTSVPRSVLPRNAAVEFTSIGLKEFWQRYKDITGKELDDKNTESLSQAAKEMLMLLTNKDFNSKVFEQLNDSRRGNLNLLASVIGRIAKDPKGALGQFQKFENRNYGCDELGENWKIDIAVPRNDKIFPWGEVRTLAHKVKTSPTDEGNDGIREKVRKRMVNSFFPNAGEVTFTIVGEKGDSSYAPTHLGPNYAIDKYFNQME